MSEAPGGVFERKDRWRRVLIPACCCAALLFPAAASAGAGSFQSSDPLLNQIWSASVTTATDMLAPGPLTTDVAGNPCSMKLPIVILDGSDRDRCPYIGDDAVTGMTLLVSTPAGPSALKAAIAWFAGAQQSDGAIPATPAFDDSTVLFDYPAYWVECLYDYVLYTGDLPLANSVWPNLVALMDRWYPSKAEQDGLLVNDLGNDDYAYIRRQGGLVSYYNAGYDLALEDASSLASWLGAGGEATAWKQRAAALAGPFNRAFFDSPVGAYQDSTISGDAHPEDGNAFAILAGLASEKQAASALAYLTQKNARPWGNTIVDDNAWDNPVWGSDAQDRVYPFIGYFEVLARFQSDDDAAAIDLIRREWGYMLKYGPGNTDWEDIGPFGGPPRDRTPSWDHGWSSGAAPALTSYVLGVRPTAPGFSTFVVDPHTGGSVTWARGSIPTPHGDLSVSWREVGGRIETTVGAPPGTTWTNRPIQTQAAAKKNSRRKLAAPTRRGIESIH